MDILQLKLKQDLLKLSLEYSKGSVDVEWIEKRIHSYVDEKKMSFTEELKVVPTKCCARMWNKGQGEKQCTHKRVTGDYCDKHNRMLKYEEVLRFGDIREERPNYDLIKQKDGQTERLHWTDPNPLDRLQCVLDKQSKKVILSTPSLVVN